MTAPEQRDPVEELRQRVRAARGITSSVFAHDYYRPLVRALGEIGQWLDGHAQSSAPDAAVQAVARELVGEGVTHTERCIKPDGTASRQVTVYRTPWQVVVSLPVIPPAVYHGPACPICEGELSSDPGIHQCEACCLYWPVDDPGAAGEIEELDGPRCGEEHRPLEDDGYAVTHNGVVLFEGAVYRCIRLATHRLDDPAVCAGVKVAGREGITSTLTWRTEGGEPRG